jgi:hypothetical protein
MVGSGDACSMVATAGAQLAPAATCPDRPDRHSVLELTRIDCLDISGMASPDAQSAGRSLVLCGSACSEADS